MSSGPPIKRLRQSLLSFSKPAKTSSKLITVDTFALYEVTDVAPDGNCMFSCLALQLGKPPEAHSEIRSEIVLYMRSHSEMVRGT